MSTVTELTRELNRTSDPGERRALKNLICAAALQLERELDALKAAVLELKL